MVIRTKPSVPKTEGATETTPGTAKLTAQLFTEQLTLLGQQLPDISPLTAQEREIVRRQGRMPDDVIAASITVIAESDTVQQEVGQPQDVKQLVVDANDWDDVERRVKAMLKVIADSNLVRRQRASIAASRAYLIGKQVVRDPDNAALIPHVEEVRRLKALARRNRTAKPAPQPQPQSTEQENPATPDSSKK